MLAGERVRHSFAAAPVFQSVTLRTHVAADAYIIDADGERSNAIEYTIHCNGG